jgi:catechol-2,3-dioxygenase
MIQFYIQLLDATVVHQDAVLAFLRYDEEHHRIAIINTPDTVPKPKQEEVRHAGLDHVAFTYPTLTQLAQQYMYLKSATPAIHPLWCVNHGPTTSMYYRDPDSNKIELQVDNFDVPNDADAFMKGPLYEENPMGTDFNPDEWAAEILGQATETGEEGLSPNRVKEIKTRVEIGTRKTLPAGF